MSRKQIAALVGLAHYDFDSGKLRIHRTRWSYPVRNISTWGPSADAEYDRPSKPSRRLAEWHEIR